jgi:cytochrome P450
MSSMFSTRVPAEHKILKSTVANKFSMTSLRDLEPLMDECSVIFLKRMRELSDPPIDLGKWLQWYAFDVIGAITFQQRFGLMEERKDVRDMIAGIEFGLWYGSIVGQIPELHPWLLGSPLLNHILTTVPALNDVHPIPKFIAVRA